MNLLLRAGLRELVARPAQLALAVAGVALGVAVVVAVDLANESARRAFRLSTEATAGRATDQVAAGSAGLDERLLARVRIEAGVAAAAPVVEDYVALAGHPGRVLHLLGVDPLLEGPFRPALVPALGAAGDLARFLVEPGAALLSKPTADELGVAPGGELELQVGSRAARVRLVGTLAPRDGASRDALANLLLVDVATAQELLARPGRLSRIELALPEGAAGEAARARIRDLLPSAAELESAAGRSRALDQMTHAFRFNLQALSWLALVCGAFLIFNTTTFSVVRRRPLFGRLRALGARRREILALVLAEAAAVGLAGSLAGLALGVALGRGLVRLVLRTIEDLYFTLGVSGFALAPGSLTRGLALGVGAALVAALAPALEAASAPPRVTLSRAALESGADRGARRAALLGALLLAAGALALLAPGRALEASFAALFALLVGYSLVVPAVLAGGLGALARWRALPVVARMAARGVVASLSRTGVAVAALALAVAVSVGIALMVGSFRRAVVDWLGTTLVGDLYVAPPTRIASAANLALDDGFVARVGALPGVERVVTLQIATFERPGETPLRVLGVDLEARQRSGLRFRAGDPDVALPAFARGEAVLVSEPFAFRRGLEVGAVLELPTVDGPRRFPVAGIYADYGSDQGVVMVDQRLYRRLFDDRVIAALAIFASPGADLDRLARAVERAAAPGAVIVQSSRALARESLAIFDRTFEVTSVLRLLAVAVAVLGILAALAALELERGRELATLRALGLSRRQLVGLVLAETGWMGAAAGLLALPLGTLLAAVMIHVVNRRSFGWSMELAFAPAPLVEAFVLALAAALAAGLLPARRLAAADPALGLREE